MKELFRSWVDLFFPPLCAHCQVECRTTLFCPECWKLCAPPDPLDRCRHCFIESESALCERCLREFIFFIRAAVFEANGATLRLCRDKKEDSLTIASFALNQWANLRWPLPDVIVPMAGMAEPAKSLSQLLERPYAAALKQWGEEWTVDEMLEEDLQLLLFDSHSTERELLNVTLALGEAFPKKIYVLSLFAYDHPSHFGPSDSSDLSLPRRTYRAPGAGMDRTETREILPKA